MVKDQKLVGPKRQLRVRLALVVGELDFVSAVQKLDDGADLAAQETVRQRSQQCLDRPARVTNTTAKSAGTLRIGP